MREYSIRYYFKMWVYRVLDRKNLFSLHICYQLRVEMNSNILENSGFRYIGFNGRDGSPGTKIFLKNLK
jgi:hypothetical protein